MIDMGIDIWQGTMSSNNIPELIQKYGDKITIMGGIDSASVDRPDWTPELVEKKYAVSAKKTVQNSLFLVSHRVLESVPSLVYTRQQAK